ncbi:MAG: hypothetical protein Q8Q08_05320 [Candidatus Omnitrophota bacterium]|nr:hypothetical protein [Candidatus Omnitrophota bacterium]MDZ4242352.1 hypothetical protein [Candidatus Omnitrophota bacterium]
MKKIILFLLVVSWGALSGCASTLRKSPQFDAAVAGVKTIAVMPADVKVYKLTAGGVQEQMDEWSDKAKADIQTNLKKHLGSRYGFEIKFIPEDGLKKDHKSLWTENRALYEAVAQSALMHAFSSDTNVNGFSHKAKNFDYTLGPEIQDLARVAGADAMVFIYGFDYESTAGRKVLAVWNVLLTGYMMQTPSFMCLGLVDGKTGDVLWFKVTPGDAQYSFREPKHLDSLIEWLTRDFLAGKK